MDLLEGVLAQIDGVEPAPDWMDDSPEKDALAADIDRLIMLLLLWGASALLANWGPCP